MVMRKLVGPILNCCVLLSFGCGFIEGSMHEPFRAHRTEQSVSREEQRSMDRLNSDATGGNRLCCDDGIFKGGFESGPATYRLSSSQNISTIHRHRYISANQQSDRYQQRAELEAVSDSITEKFTKPLAGLERQMKLFYEYITRAYNPAVLPPEWGRMPNIKFNSTHRTRSATHTEFIMVYKILQDAGVPSMGGGLLQMNSVSDFQNALRILRGNLPAKIYSAKAMCPVCEAFLTSLYNVCGCEGVFISKWNDYRSPSGHDGHLKKVYQHDKRLKELAYLDLATPDNRNVVRTRARKSIRSNLTSDRSKDKRF